jgi:hypothetical protein
VVLGVQDVGDDDQLRVAVPAPDQMAGGQLVQVGPDERVVPQYDVALRAPADVHLTADRQVRGGAGCRHPSDLAQQLARRVDGTRRLWSGRPAPPVHLLHHRGGQAWPTGDLAGLPVHDRRRQVPRERHTLAGHSGRDHKAEIELVHHRGALVAQAL